jgi:UDP-2,4-diacetamido-2,4,6-trideoxy-beta-L-altropyranose hydrolase
MPVAFRVDASLRIGTGHFMRCLALADALKSRGAQVRFVSRHIPGHMREMLASKGHELAPLNSTPRDEGEDKIPHSRWLGASQATDAHDTIQVLSDKTWEWLVVDQYALDARWESVLRKAVKRILVIDDLADRIHDCDVLLDQNFYQDQNTRYAGKVSPHCQLLIGPRYALLREEFCRMRGQINPRTGSVKRILVFWGGVDPYNYTARTIEALANIASHDLHVDVVIGSQHPHREQIELACASHAYVCHVQTNRMAELMASADLAVGAGGSASWERCCLGLPALAFSMADNQGRLVADSAVEGLLYAPLAQPDITSCIELHLKALLHNPSLLQLISRRGWESVDGRGVQRVLLAIGCSSIAIREATQADSDSMFAWRNHSSIRAVSRNSDPIEKSTHEAWFNAVLSDPNRLLLIGECQGETIGVVRFDVCAGEAEVSMYLVPEYQGEGLGSDLLLAAEQWLAKYRSDVYSIKAEVLGRNQSSHRLFRAGGYQAGSSLYYKRAHRL